jgi:hypothetical protein
MAKKTDITIKPAPPIAAAPETPAPALRAAKPIAAKTKPAPKPVKAPTAKAKRSTKPAAPAKPRNTREDVALRAYYIAEKRRAQGLPGDEHQDWLEAERQILAERAKRKKAKKA